VPRDNVAAGTTATPSTTSRPADAAPSYGGSTSGNNPYGTPPTTSSAQPPRPIGQPVQRDASTSSRPVPPTTPPTQPQAAPAGQYVLNSKGQPVDPHAKSATESCGSRVFVALAICMEERCEDSRWRNGDDCVRILERKRQRQNR
jgi:hypothetical protein